MNGRDVVILRTKLNMTQGEFSIYIGHSRTGVARWEQHPERPVSGEGLYKIKKALAESSVPEEILDDLELMVYSNEPLVKRGSNQCPTCKKIYDLLKESFEKK